MHVCVCVEAVEVESDMGRGVRHVLQSNLPHFIEAAAAAVQLFPAYSCNFLPYRSTAILPGEVR